MNLTLGTVQFGLHYGVANPKGQISLQESKEIIQFSRSNEIHCLDTAIAYGSSEDVLGMLGVKDFQIISKLPEIPKEIPDKKSWIIDSVNRSLDKLKIDKLYALLLHRSDDLTHPFKNEIYEAIEKLKIAGKIQKFGISIYNFNELEKVYIPSKIEIVQSPMNVLDRGLLNSGWITKLKNNNCEIHIRSIFLQGLLLMDDKQRPIRFNRWNFIWGKWKKWLDDNQISPLRACLNYVKSIAEIDQIIVGVDSLNHLKEVHKLFNSELIYSYPEDLYSDDPNLINPSLWNQI